MQSWTTHTHTHTQQELTSWYNLKEDTPFLFGKVTFYTQLAYFFFSLKYGKSLKKTKSQSHHGGILFLLWVYLPFIVHMSLYLTNRINMSSSRRSSSVGWGMCEWWSVTEVLLPARPLQERSLKTGFQNTIKLSKGDQAFLLPKDKVSILVITVVSTQVI